MRRRRMTIMGAVVAVLALVGLSLPAVTAQGAVKSAPFTGDNKSPLAVGSDSAGTDFIVYGCADGGLCEKTSKNWNVVEPIKGPIGGDLGPGNVSNPAIAVHPNGSLDVFWQASYNLYEVSATAAGTWGKIAERAPSDFSSAPGTYGSFNGLTAGSDNNGNDYVFFAASSDSSLWEMWHYTNGWRGPQRIYEPTGGGFLENAPPSAIESGPGVAVHPNGQQDVTWWGNTNSSEVANLWDAAYANGAWKTTNTGVVNGLSASLEPWPAAGADSTNRVDVFWLDPNNGLYWAYKVGTTWHNLSGKQLLSITGYQFSLNGPSVVVHPDGHIDVFWDGEANGDGPPSLWEISYNGSTWSAPISHGVL